MKYLSFLFLLISFSAAFAQSEIKKDYMLNPDGEFISFHLTPYMTTGKIFNQELDAELSFKVEMIAPMANNVSLKIFYDYMNTTYTNKNNSFYDGGTPIQLNKIGATLSFYLN